MCAHISKFTSTNDIFLYYSLKKLLEVSSHGYISLKITPVVERVSSTRYVSSIVCSDFK